MLPLCEPGDSTGIPWSGHGFSRCFLEMVGAISAAGVLYVLGLGVIVLGECVLMCCVLLLVLTC